MRRASADRMAPSAERLVAAGRAPEPAHNNCSGKHAGMLTVARHLGAPLAGYVAADHPVQRRVAATLAEMAGIAACRSRRSTAAASRPTR